MDFLVIRDKNKKNLDVQQFDTFAEAKAAKRKLKDSGHEGELILAFGSDMKSFLMTFTEYRPDHWRDLIKKSEN
jgi:hypothetical protein